MQRSHSLLRKATAFLAMAVLAATGLVATPTPAEAGTFGSRSLYRGLSGEDVREAQIRIAGWYSNCAGVHCFDHFPLDGIFGAKTERATRNFQKAYGLTIDGVINGDDFSTLRALASSDGSTAHFSWSEFTEKSATCTTQHKGTFNGGRVSTDVVREGVRRLMYRLEVIRHRMRDAYPVSVWSGFRSVDYNDCLAKRSSGVAKNSQHLYGTAYDGKMKHLNQGVQRSLAKTSQFHAIFCYGGKDAHNHLDIRKDNGATGGDWMWPARDGQGRDITSSGALCYGGYSSPPSTGYTSPAEGPALVIEQSSLDTDFSVDDAEANAKHDTSEEVWLGADDE